MNNYYLKNFETIYSLKPSKRKALVIEDINTLYRWLKANNFPDWETTVVTKDHGEFPFEYLGLMFECESGLFANGKRLFQFLSLTEIPEYYEMYNFSKYIPFALPFALDGCGNFYIFNFRCNDPGIYAVSSGNLNWEECFKIADSFMEFIRQDTPPDEIINAREL